MRNLPVLCPDCDAPLEVSEDGWAEPCQACRERMLLECVRIAEGGKMAPSPTQEHVRILVDLLKDMGWRL